MAILNQSKIIIRGRRFMHVLGQFLNRHLLCVDKTLDCNGDGQINVVCIDVLMQGHLCTCLCHANHALQVSYHDRIRCCGSGSRPGHGQVHWIEDHTVC